MNYKHEEFEVMCALAACGQLTEHDRTELEEHALTCTGCHERQMEMDQASYACFLLFADQTKKSSLPAGIHERFNERALEIGIPLRNTEPLSPVLRFGGIAAAVVLMMLLFKGTYHSPMKPAMPRTEIVANTVGADANPASKQIMAVATTSAQPSLRYRGPRHHGERRFDPSPTESKLYMRTTSQFSLASGFRVPNEAVLFNSGRITGDDNLLHPWMKPLDPRSLPLLWNQDEFKVISTRSFHFEPKYATLSYFVSTGRLSAQHLLDFDSSRHLPNDNDRSW
jgi:hypothetical protein